MLCKPKIYSEIDHTCNARELVHNAAFKAKLFRILTAAVKHVLWPNLGSLIGILIFFKFCAITPASSLQNLYFSIKLNILIQPYIISQF